MGAVAMTDSELVEASRRGELDAFGQLVARYRDLVCAVSFSSTGDRRLSEDVAQDTFLAAWRHLDRVRDTTRVRPWLCGIARNLGRKARKRTRREQPADVDVFLGDSASPLEHVARVDSQRVVRDALLRVPEVYREVLVLYYGDDCSIRDVAETLGISEAAVMQRLSRGRRYLADSVTALIEHSLRERRPRRDLVAAVLAAIAAFALPSRADASPARRKGATMYGVAGAVSAFVVAGVAVYLVTRTGHDAHSPAAPHALHYGAGVAHPPTLAASATPIAIAARTAVASDLGYLPADADAVLGVDVAQLRQTALWQHLVAPAISGFEPVQQFKSTCGFDPIASLSSVTIGLRGFGSDSFTGTMVLHGIDRTKAMTCFEHDGVASAEQQGIQLTIDGSVALLTFPDGHHAGFTFIDATTVLVVLGPEAATRAGMARIAAGGGALDRTASPFGGASGAQVPAVDASTGFAALFPDVNATDSLWLVLTDASPLLATINATLAQSTAIRLHGAYGSIGVTDEIAVQGGIRLSSPALAAQLVSDTQKQLDELAVQGQTGQHFDQLDVVSDDSDVLVDVRMNVLQLLAFASSGVVTVAPGKDGSEP
jgi:RNA polymerase sigma factor (sigma-70 family)